MRRTGGRARRWPAAAAALVSALVLGSPGTASALTTTPPGDPGANVPTSTVAAVPSAVVHEGSGCAGPAASTVTGDFSVAVADLLGGPLAAVTVRSDTLVVASAVAMLDAQGSGCADLAAIPAGSYVVAASIGDVSTTTALDVPAPPQPPATVDPPPVTDPGTPPTDVVDPVDPPPTTDPGVPDPGATSPAREAAPPTSAPGPGTASPEVSTVAVEPAAARAADSGRPTRAHQGSTRTPSSATVVAQPAAPSPTPSVSAAATTVTAVLDSTKTAGGKVVSVLVSSDRPTAVTVIGFVVLEVLGLTLLIAFAVLVLSRAPRRRD